MHGACHSSKSISLSDSAEAPADTHAAAETESQSGTEAGSAASFDADLAAAQRAQREALLVGQSSLNDSCKRLLEVREAMQQQGQQQPGMVFS